MKFEAKVYKRLGAAIGGIIGVLAMMIAICTGETLMGAILLLAFSCIGFGVGSVLEQKYGSK